MSYGQHDPEEPGFDAGPDEEVETGECVSCGETRELVADADEPTCQECCDGQANAAADCAEERRAERRAMACDLGIGPSDRWDD